MDVTIDVCLYSAPSGGSITRTVIGGEQHQPGGDLGHGTRSTSPIRRWPLASRSSSSTSRTPPTCASARRRDPTTAMNTRAEHVQARAGHVERGRVLACRHRDRSDVNAKRSGADGAVRVGRAGPSSITDHNGLAQRIIDRPDGRQRRTVGHPAPECRFPSGPTPIDREARRTRRRERRRKWRAGCASPLSVGMHRGVSRLTAAG